MKIKNCSTMYLTVHALTGTFIGKQMVNPLLAFILGFFSHFILDIIPHTEPELFDKSIDKKDKLRTYSKKKLKKILGIAFIDIMVLATILAIILAILYRQGETINSLAIVSGIFGSLLPDMLTGCFLFSKGKLFKKFTKFHRTIHFSPEKIQISKFEGTLIQIIIIIIAINFLL